MTRADNTRFLAQATADRHQATLGKPATPSRTWTAPASPSTSAPSQQQPACPGPRSTATPPSAT